MAAKKAKKPKPPKKLKPQTTVEKATIKSRTDCSTLVGSKGPQSTVWQTVGSVSDAGTKLVAAGTALDDADKAAIKADADALAAHTLRDAALVDWDTTFDVYASNVTRYAPTPAAVTALGLSLFQRVTHTLQIPLGVTATYNVKTGLVEVTVKPAPGLKHCEIQYTATPQDPTSWKRVKGDGLKRKIAGLAPGTYYVRACSVRADEESDYTDPVAVVVK